jgi:hypothetical protein
MYVYERTQKAKKGGVEEPVLVSHDAQYAKEECVCVCLCAYMHVSCTCITIHQLPSTTRIFSINNRWVCTYMQADEGFRAFVGNIPYQATPNQLRFLFESKGFTIEHLSCPYSVERTEAGPVKRYKGYAFVHFADEMQLQRAIETLNGAELLGRALAVRARTSAAEHAGEKEKRVAGAGAGAGMNQEQARAMKPKTHSRTPEDGERSNQPKLYTRWQDDGDYSKQVFCSRLVWMHYEPDTLPIHLL